MWRFVAVEGNSAGAGATCTGARELKRGILLHTTRRSMRSLWVEVAERWGGNIFYVHLTPSHLVHLSLSLSLSLALTYCRV